MLNHTFIHSGVKMVQTKGKKLGVGRNAPSRKGRCLVKANWALVWESNFPMGNCFSYIATGTNRFLWGASNRLNAQKIRWCILQIGRASCRERV